MTAGNDLQEASIDLAAVLNEEIEGARKERRAVSRQMLAKVVQIKSDLPAAEAMDYVQRYCDNESLPIPEYLAEEFAIPYLKVLAVVLVAVAIGVFYWAMHLRSAGKEAWPVFILGVLTCGIAVLLWVRSLEREATTRLR